MRLVTLTTVTYEDVDGRAWLRALPQGVPASQASIGIPLGPPSLEDLGLPKDIEIRLHNQLYARKLLTSDDVRMRTTEVYSALMAALRLDVQRILALYEGAGAE